ncbi:MAG TPA: GxGYxYP domain-containing protein, partial [Verrucomicrobiae bacterium]|nr:GxGYxYP domain-containing protein [Verrucomicrobiae bacterium]
MKTRRSFLKTSLFAGAGIPLAAGFGRAIAAKADGAGDYVWPFSSQNPSVVYTFNARHLRNLDLNAPGSAEKVWETLHLLAALQGLANRNAPRFYLFYCSEYGIDTDQFWFDWFRGEDGWLRNTQILPLTDLTTTILTLRDAFDGLAVYDPNVPATSNLASTAAGVERLLPVRLDRSPTSLF